MRIYLTIWFTVVLHLIRGISLIFDESARNVTSLSILLSYIPYAPLAGLVLILTALVTIVQLTYLTHHPILLLPQQVIVLLGAGSVIQAIMVGHFSDGVIRSRAFIIADQSIYILLAIFYILIYVPEVMSWNSFRKT